MYPRKDFYFFQTLKFFNRKDRGRVNVQDSCKAAHLTL